MARIAGIQPEKAGLWLRLFYGAVRRATQKVTGKASLPAPFMIAAHRTRLLLSQAHMEAAGAGMSSVPHQLKALASLAAATRIGCPF